jgi:hypothetical protein
LNEQNFIFARHSGLNFSSFDGQAGLSYYVPKWNNLTLRALYDYQLLTYTYDPATDTFSSHGLVLNIELPFALAASQHLVVGVNGRIGFATHPDRSQRDEVDGYLDYTIGITRALSLEAYVDVWFRQYETGNHHEGGGLCPGSELPSHELV